MSVSFSSEGDRRRARFWPYVWKLLRLQWLLTWHRVRRAKGWGRFGYGMAALGLLALAAFLILLSAVLLSFLRSPALAEYIDPAPFLAAVPAIAVSAAFVATLLLNFGTLLRSLYLARDMDFLLAMPIPMRAVFASKLLQAILPAFGYICLVSLPVLFGLGISAGYNILYYPLVVIALALTSLAAAGLAGLLVAAVVRVVPARQVAEVLAFLGAMLSLICSQSGQLTRHMRVAPGQASSSLGALGRLNTPWSPLAWIGRGLAAVGQGQWLTGGPGLLLSLGLAAGVFLGALELAERQYYSGWSRMQGTARRKRAVRTAGRPRTTLHLERLLPQALLSLVRKDLLLLRRDLRQASFLVRPLIMGIVFAFSFLRSTAEVPTQGLGAEILGQGALYPSLGISLFVGWMLVAPLGLQAFAREAKSFWLVKSAPLRPATILTAKFIVAYAPALLLSWAFCLGLGLVQRLGSALAYNLAAVAFGLSGAGGINVAFGSSGTPQAKGCVAQIVTLLYLGLSFLLFSGPPIACTLLGASPKLGQALGLALGGALGIVAAFVPLRLVRGQIRATDQA